MVVVVAHDALYHVFLVKTTWCFPSLLTCAFCRCGRIWYHYEGEDAVTQQTMRKKMEVLHFTHYYCGAAFHFLLLIIYQKEEKKKILVW